MGHDEFAGLAAVSIPALATIVVAWISVRRGSRAAAKDEPFEAQEHGEHAHTRDVIRLETQRILDRIEISDLARGLGRQSEQIGVSADRLRDRESADDEQN